MPFFINNWPLSKRLPMKTYLVKVNKKFIGRTKELQIIHDLNQQGRPGHQRL